MLRPSLFVYAFGCLLHGATVMDRVAVVVGKSVVKTSDIARDLRASEFMNREPLDLSAGVSRKASERLVDQTLIRQEIANGGYSESSEEDAASFLQQMRKDRFGGSDDQMRVALTRYGLSVDELRQYLRWQLTVLRFIDQRFKPGVLVTDEDVKAYYDAHLAELQKAFPKDHRLESLTPNIRETVVGERVNQAFEEWLDQTRQRTRVETREAAIREGVSP